MLDSTACQGGDRLDLPQPPTLDGSESQRALTSCRGGNCPVRRARRAASPFSVTLGGRHEGALGSPSGARASPGRDALTRCPTPRANSRGTATSPGSFQAWWGELVGFAGHLPGQPVVIDQPSGQALLGVGGHDQPGPPVGLFGAGDAGGGPAQGVPREPVEVLGIEAAQVGPSAQVEVGAAGSRPPQPQGRGVPTRPLVGYGQVAGRGTARALFVRDARWPHILPPGSSSSAVTRASPISGAPNKRSGRRSRLAVPPARGGQGVGATVPNGAVPTDWHATSRPAPPGCRAATASFWLDRAARPPSYCATTAALDAHPPRRTAGSPRAVVVRRAAIGGRRGGRLRCPCGCSLPAGWCWWGVAFAG